MRVLPAVLLALASVVACSSTTTASPCADAGITGPLPPGCVLQGAGCGPCCGLGCSGTITQADCEQFGATAGCETSTLVPSDGGAGCQNGCSFTNCSKAVPACTPPAGDAATD